MDKCLSGVKMCDAVPDNVPVEISMTAIKSRLFGLISSAENIESLAAKFKYAMTGACCELEMEEFPDAKSIDSDSPMISILHSYSVLETHLHEINTLLRQINDSVFGVSEIGEGCDTESKEQSISSKLDTHMKNSVTAIYEINTVLDYLAMYFIGYESGTETCDADSDYLIGKLGCNINYLERSVNAVHDKLNLLLAHI